MKKEIKKSFIEAISEGIGVWRTKNPDGVFIPFELMDAMEDALEDIVDEYLEEHPEVLEPRLLK